MPPTVLPTPDELDALIGEHAALGTHTEQFNAAWAACVHRISSGLPVTDETLLRPVLRELTETAATMKRFCTNETTIWDMRGRAVTQTLQLWDHLVSIFGQLSTAAAILPSCSLGSAQDRNDYLVRMLQHAVSQRDAMREHAEQHGHIHFPAETAVEWDLHMMTLFHVTLGDEHLPAFKRLFNHATRTLGQIMTMDKLSADSTRH